MSSILAVFWGRVRGGRIALEDKRGWTDYLSKLDGQEVALTLRRPEYIRTNAENRYYWGVIVRMLSDDMGLTPDDTHELLKGLFLKEGVEVEGKRFEIIRSTAALTIAEFEKYCEQVRLWAAEELSCRIPLPGEIILED